MRKVLVVGSVVVLAIAACLPVLERVASPLPAAVGSARDDSVSARTRAPSSEAPSTSDRAPVRAAVGTERPSGSTPSDAVTELDDIVLEPTVEVAGRVVDTHGRACASVEVRLSRRAPSPRPRLRSRAWHAARTDRHGRFEVRTPVASGTWELRLRGARLLPPASRVVAIAPGTPPLQIVVVAAEDVETIRGVVVDDLGAPIARAKVTSDPPMNDLRPVRTAADGTFRIARHDGSPEGPFAIVCEPHRHGRGRTARVHHWGARDVQLVTPRGVGLTVRAVRATDHRPVERFGIRIFADPASGERAPSGMLSAPRRHDGGVATVRGIAPGRYLVRVEPTPSTGSCAAPIARVDLVDAERPAELSVHLVARSERAVRVLRDDGSPAAASALELIEHIGGEPVSLSGEAWRPHALDGSSTIRPIVLDEAVTDADGAAVLSGPGDRDLYLRVRGPTHPPVLVDRVRLDAAAPLEVVLPPGAAVLGRVEPADLVRRLRDLVGRDGAPAPGVRLWRQGIRREHFPMTASPSFVPISGADGRFTLAGVPPGDWVLEVGIPTAADHVATRRVLPLPRLRDGERRQIVLDLAASIPGRVHGKVQLDGAPWQGTLLFTAENDLDPDAHPLVEHGDCMAGASGSFDLMLLPGTWRGRLWLPELGGGLPAVGEVVVDAGATHEVLLRARHAERRIRVLAPDGAPVEGLWPIVRVAGSTWGVAGRTDAHGRTTLGGTPGRHELSAERRVFRSHAAIQAFRRENGFGPAADAALRVPLGTVELVPGEQSEIELRLPPEWER